MCGFVDVFVCLLFCVYEVPPKTENLLKLEKEPVFLRVEVDALLMSAETFFFFFFCPGLIVSDLRSFEGELPRNEAAHSL